MAHALDRTMAFFVPNYVSPNMFGFSQKTASMEVPLKTKRWWGWLLGWLLGLGWNVSPAQATLLVYRSLDQQIQTAASIVRGRVVQKHSFVYQGNGHIYTDVRLHLLETLKGQAPHELVIRQLGGTVGERTTLIAGSARFVVGEEVVVFLEKPRHPEFLFVQDLGAGKYTVFLHEGRTLLRRNVDGLAFYRHTTNVTDRIRTPQFSERPLDLDTLRQRTQILLQQPTLRHIPTPRQRFNERIQRAKDAIMPKIPAHKHLPSFQDPRHPIRSIHDQSTQKYAPLRALQKQRLPSFAIPLRGSLLQKRLQSAPTLLSPTTSTQHAPSQGGSR